MTAPSPMTLNFMGAKAGYYLGSMSAASDQLVMESEDHHYVKGDRIIVEIGGEAGAGARATVGVGGTFPAHSFVDEATLIASGAPAWTTSVGDPAAYAEDTGRCFRWVEALTEWVNYSTGGDPGDDMRYNERLFLPLALVATVLDVDGVTLTLSESSVVATTGARIWADNRNVLLQAFKSQDSSMQIDDGEYAVSGYFNDFAATGVELFGESRTGVALFSPRGCGTLAMTLNGATDLAVHDLTLKVLWTDDAVWMGYDGIDTATVLRPLRTADSDRSAARDIKTVDCIFGAITLNGDGCEILRAENVHAIPSRFYAAGWCLQLESCTNSTIDTCTSTSPYIHEAIEVIFGSGNTVSNCISTNGKFARNTATLVDWEDNSMTITAGSASDRFAADPGFVFQTLHSENNNFDDDDVEGGSIRRCTYTIAGDPGINVRDGMLLRHSALNPAGDAIVVEDCTFTANGYSTWAIRADGSGDIQDMNLDGVTADAGIALTNGSIANSNGPLLRYCDTNVTLSSGNSFDVTEVSCS